MNGRKSILVGWAVLVVFAVADVASNGSKDTGYAAGITVVAAVMAGWVHASSGKAALLASAVLGALVTLAQAVYLTVDIADHDAANGTVDGIGLIAGVLIGTGAAMALGQRRSPARA
ncbi:MAG TPA: hypothetical protein VM093_02130 [Aeromicrobium sp.]|nr:hypothetical protein [Aeromicrobium sp.]